MEIQGSKGCNLIFIWRIWCCGYESGDVGLRIRIAGMVVLVSCLRAPRPENPTAIRHGSISSHTSSHRGQKAYFIEPLVQTLVLLETILRDEWRNIVLLICSLGVPEPRELTRHLSSYLGLLTLHIRAVHLLA